MFRFQRLPLNGFLASVWILFRARGQEAIHVPQVRLTPLQCSARFDSYGQAVLVFGSPFAIGVVWDSFSIYRGYWTFNGRFLVGVTVGLMPIEEYLFIIVIPLLTLVVNAMAKRKR